ncbi:MAG: MFS transporter [Gemmataceae bacterium]|nr:MFS transporter [Gemmataceae bacterium]
MEIQGKADRVELFRFDTPSMRAFHMTWLAFFLCFFSWFAAAPLMPIIRKEFSLTDAQVGNLVIASVAITILARLLVGRLCDQHGPRLTYTWLLILGSIPVMCLGLAQDYFSFLALRLAIGAIGASFVITQFHTTLMFSKKCVGMATATTAGWGNLGGGVMQMVMPLLFTALIYFGLAESQSWRLAMVIPGAFMLVTGILYYRLTQDTPEGNYSSLRAAGRLAKGPLKKGLFRAAMEDRRVWILALAYGASFGLEITMHNLAVLYFLDEYQLGLKEAGLMAGCFGLMAMFARPLGGWLSDRCGLSGGLRGRALLLGFALFAEGLFLMLFSQVSSLGLAVVMLACFGLFSDIASGANFGIVPFINTRAVGSVAGIVGAGGNLGAVLSGFLFKGSMPWSSAMLLLGSLVAVCSLATLLMQFAPAVDEGLVQAQPAGVS